MSSIAQASSPTISPIPNWRNRLLTLLPLGFTAWLALQLSEHPTIANAGLSALTLAMFAGMFAGNTLPRGWLTPLAPGMQVARHHMLRLGVGLYGLRLTFDAIVALGLAGVLIPLAMLVSTLVLGTWIGVKLLGLERREALVVSAGSAVCGAAAAIAMASVVKTDNRQTAVAVATVVLFGTAGMVLYPYLFELAVGHLHLAVSERTFGIFTGATLHEVAQVIASGKMISDATADAAVVAKMVRVLALGPLLLVMALWTRASERKQGLDTGNAGWSGLLRSVPWFALGFVAVMAINSAGMVPPGWKPALIALDNWLLATAMLAIGLQTRLIDLLRTGRAPMILAGILFVFLVAGGAALCWLTA